MLLGNNSSPLPNEKRRPYIGHDLLPITDVPRPLLLPIRKLEVVFHKETTHNRLYGVRSEEATGARLPAEAKVHVRWADADEAICLVFGVQGPAETVEGLRLRDDVGVARERSGGKADVSALGDD